MYIYMYIHLHAYIYIYIYIYMLGVLADTEGRDNVARRVCVHVMLPNGKHHKHFSKVLWTEYTETFPSE